MHYTMNHLTSQIDDITNFEFNFTDEDIATEGVVSDIKNAIIKKIQTSKSINKWYSDLLLNLNKFKNAQLDEEQNKDILTVLKIAQPRTELNFTLFNRYYSFLSLKGNLNKRIDGKPFGMRSGPVIEGRMTTLENEITKSIEDIRACMKAAQESKEYKRIKKGKYENIRVQIIPLSNITDDMKNSKSSAASFQSHLEDFNRKIFKLDRIDRVTEKMIVFLNMVTSYYKFRISLLTIYLERAKGSLKGTLRNAIEKNEDQYKSKGSLTLNKAKWTTKKFDKETLKHLQETYQHALNTKSYQEYKPLYDEITKSLGLNGKIIRKLKFNFEKGTLSAYWVSTNTEKIQVGGRPLYHGVPAHVTKTLTVLKPSYCGNDGYLFPEPRIYFHLGVPLNRCSNRSDPAAGEQSYTPVQPISTVWKDDELGGTAVYLTTTTPIKVKKVQLKRHTNFIEKKIDLSFNENR